jgi:hypothetical protein
MRNPQSKYVEKVSKCCIFGELAYFWAFLTEILATLTVRGLATEPDIVLS